MDADRLDVLVQTFGHAPSRRRPIGSPLIGLTASAPLCFATGRARGGNHGSNRGHGQRTVLIDGLVRTVLQFGQAPQTRPGTSKASDRRCLHSP